MHRLGAYCVWEGMKEEERSPDMMQELVAGWVTVQEELRREALGRVRGTGRSLSGMGLTRERWCCTRRRLSRFDMNTCQTSTKTPKVLPSCPSDWGRSPLIPGQPPVADVVVAQSSRSFDRCLLSHWRFFAALSAGFSAGDI